MLQRKDNSVVRLMRAAPALALFLCAACAKQTASPPPVPPSQAVTTGSNPAPSANPAAKNLGAEPAQFHDAVKPPPPHALNDPYDDHGRPVELVAKDLGVTPEQFREAFKKVRPAGRGQQPTEEQRQANRKVLSETLGVSPEKLDAVMDKYRPGGPTPGSRGSQNPQIPPPN